VLFGAQQEHYLHSVSATEPAPPPSSLRFLELRSYHFEPVHLHVTAADVLVGPRVDREGFR